MRDADFEYFITKFGEPTHRGEAYPSAIEKWRRKLPDQFLAYWTEEGWCGYADGLLWTVDPSDYEELVDKWLEDSPLEQLDAFHVVARSAFGHFVSVRGVNRNGSIYLPAYSLHNRTAA